MDAPPPAQPAVAEAALTQLPSWLSAARGDVFKSAAWGEMTAAVSAQIKPILKRRNVQFFSDLNEQEKGALIAEVERMMRERSVAQYDAFLETLTGSLNERLRDEVARDLRRADNEETQVELVMRKSAEATAVVLDRIPQDNRAGLRLMLNQAFPAQLRRGAWRLYLANAAARVEYEDRVRRRRMDTISADDVAITNRAQSVLDVCAPRLSGDSATVMAMKTALSYRHSSAPFDDELFYRLAVPLALTYDVTDVASLVEGYSALLALPRPRYVPRADDPDEALATREAVGRTYEAADKLPGLRELLAHVASVHADGDPLPVDEGDGRAEGGVEGVDSGGNEAARRVAALAFLAPCLEFCFVGVLCEETLLYVWDTCLLAGFDRVVPRVAAVLLLLMRDQLLQCRTLNVMGQVVREQARALSVRSVQLLMSRHFVGDLCREAGAGARMPEATGVVLSRLTGRFFSGAESPESSGADSSDDDDEDDVPLLRLGEEAKPAAKADGGDDDGAEVYAPGESRKGIIKRITERVFGSGKFDDESDTDSVASGDASASPNTRQRRRARRRWRKVQESPVAALKGEERAPWDSPSPDESPDGVPAPAEAKSPSPVAESRTASPAPGSKSPSRTASPAPAGRSRTASPAPAGRSRTASPAPDAKVPSRTASGSKSPSRTASPAPDAKVPSRTASGSKSPSRTASPAPDK